MTTAQSLPNNSVHILTRRGDNGCGDSLLQQELRLYSKASLGEVPVNRFDCLLQMAAKLWLYSKDSDCCGRPS